MKSQSRVKLKSAWLFGPAVLLGAFLPVYRMVAGDDALPSVVSNSRKSGPTVQATQGYINRTFLTTHTTAPFDSSGGDLIIACASSHAGVTMTPSDSFENTWISLAGPTNTTTGFDLRTQLWYAKRPMVGAGHTFTLNLSAPQSLVVSVFVVKGSNVSDPIDAISIIGDDGGSQTLAITSPDITTTNRNDLLLGFAKSAISETWASGSGYTEQGAASSNFLEGEAGWAETPGTYNSTFDIDSPGAWQAVTVAVRPPINGSTSKTETLKE